MKRIMEKLETLLEWGGLKKEIILLVIFGISLLLSLFHIPLPFSIAWVAIILCGVPIILEAIIGLVTAFDIKADVLVSLALVASICIGEHFAGGEIAFIMQLGALLEDLTVAKARAGIEKLVHVYCETVQRKSTSGTSTGARFAASIAGGNDSCRRRDYKWTNFYQSGSDDRRILASG